MKAPGPSPAEPARAGDDEPIGVTLRRLRKARRMSGREVAAAVGLSQSTVSRIERGIGSPDLGDIHKIARVVGADDRQTQELIRQAQRLHDRITEWRPTSDSLADRQVSVAEWEARAQTILDFQPTVLPGLLQISPYAKAVLRLFQSLARIPAERLTEAAVLAAVSARVQRQQVIADRSKTFSFVIMESVLKNAPCPPVEMLAQIHHLREIATGHENVSLTVIPDGRPMTIPALHGFTLFDRDVILIDVYNTGLLSRGREDIEIYHRIFGMNLDCAEPIAPYLDRYQALYIDALTARR
ncbi:transcriptional regulator [Actinoplanes sp. NBRC 14428]|uniref:Helix-turn-helix protein n=1 Tax=Pseudosporangium ferrugineum TaxID=439699 RepID=A0A2T0SHL4_9ACTN|nr:helix-turn-helix transcriptional regulator [Pseudosporangium ferrugineum]PRY32908.1 helix-turn-helix protein [Pseudosporangium ferrugineum]BCJ49131.1 transcriptional regulator [Actinoplanes sp. NBRC 14428]